MFNEPRYTEIRANLDFFKKRYEEILKEQPRNRETASRKSDYNRAREIYYKYIEQQLNDVNEKLPH